MSEEDRIELTLSSQVEIETSNRRQLASEYGSYFTTKAVRSLLVVRVSYTGTILGSDAATQSWFGTSDSAATHMAKQYSDCSNEQLTFEAGVENPAPNPLNVIDGVLEVSIAAAMIGEQFETAAENAVIAATKSALGDVTDLSSLYDHVAFCIPAGTVR